VKDRKYTNVDQFKHDFELVIKNAKIYNGPDTVYFKQAERLEVQGQKIMERDKNITVVEDPVVVVDATVFEDDEETNESGSGGQSIGMSVSAVSAVKPQKVNLPNREVLEKRSYKTKQYEELEMQMYDFYHMDGTKVHEQNKPMEFSNPVDLFARFYDVKIVDLLESYYGMHSMVGGEPILPDPYVAWNHVYTNPFTEEERKKRGLTVTEMEKRVCVFGGERGFRYVDSLRSFLAEAFGVADPQQLIAHAGDNDQVKVKKEHDMEVDKKPDVDAEIVKVIQSYEDQIKKWTRGAEVLVNETRAYLKRVKTDSEDTKMDTEPSGNENGDETKKTSAITVELGTADIAAVIRDCEKEIEILLREVEVEFLIAGIKTTENAATTPGQPPQGMIPWVPLAAMVERSGILNGAQPLHITEQNLNEALELIRNEIKQVMEMKDEVSQDMMAMNMQMGMPVRNERLRRIQNGLAGIILFARRVVIRNTGGGYVSGVGAMNPVRPPPGQSPQGMPQNRMNPQQMRRPMMPAGAQRMPGMPGMPGQMPPGMQGT
jgi:hypothetical protein